MATADDPLPRPGLVPALARGAALFAAGMVTAAALLRSPTQPRLPLGGGPVTRGLFTVLSPALVPLYAAALSVPLFAWLARRRPPGRRVGLAGLAWWGGLVLLVSVLAELALAVVTEGALGVRAQLAFFLPVRLLGTVPVVAAAAALGQVLVLRERAAAAARDAAAARALASEARLGVLMDQLRPHFLFNALQTVSTLLHRDPAAADEALGDLAELLRASLDHRDARTIPLAEELHVVERFLAIARARFGDRLDTAVDVASDVGDAAVPPFLLQPLLENAVRHGLERRGAGRVAVSARVERGDLLLTVHDTGPGWRGDAVEGMGLASVRERLRVLYGERAALTTASDAAHGTTVVVRLPHERPAA